MSDNYPSDVKLNENPNGTVSFAPEVVATIAGLAATEVDGVASMISPASGLADMFTRKNNRNLTKGVRIDLDDNKVAVDITITVDYGSPVPDVARNIQENVKKAIETMSGLAVRNVDVHVTGISFEREQRANAELDEQHRKMLEKTEEAEAERTVESDASGKESDQTRIAPVLDEAEGAEASFEEAPVEDAEYEAETEADIASVEDGVAPADEPDVCDESNADSQSDSEEPSDEYGEADEEDEDEE